MNKAKMKKAIARLVPEFVKRGPRTRRHTKALQSVPRLGCKGNCLVLARDVNTEEIFSSQDLAREWNEIELETQVFEIPEGSEGVNPGDRRAIYYLVRKLNRCSVLEIGTHIGASTTYFAAALRKAQELGNISHSKLVSVDILDVNDAASKPWLEFDAKYSPIEIINKMECGHFVDFVTSTSLDYFSRCPQKYDFIFLDGDHSAKTVYREIPAALQLLEENGLVLLHDYFPKLSSLWSDGCVLPGPFLATERLIREGANLKVLPLGKLPWPTKLQSNITSLALLTKDT